MSLKPMVSVVVLTFLVVLLQAGNMAVVVVLMPTLALVEMAG
jgi:hypothetical protein